MNGIAFHHLVDIFNIHSIPSGKNGAIAGAIQIDLDEFA